MLLQALSSYQLPIALVWLVNEAKRAHLSVNSGKHRGLLSQIIFSKHRTAEKRDVLYIIHDFL